MVAAAVRDLYTAQPGAMEVVGVSLYPLHVLAASGTSGQMYRIPVIPGSDGAVSFGAAQPGVVAARGTAGVVARDIRRIGEAVARGAMPRSRAVYWAARSAAGHDIDILDQLASGVIAAAGAEPGPDDYQRLFGMSGAAQAGEDCPEYDALYGTPETGRQRADAREVAARAAVAALTDDEVFARMFGKTTNRAPSPVSASAPAGAGKPGQQYRVRVPQVSVRVPDMAAASGWRSIELKAGDRVPLDAHPEDIDWLRHRMNRHGAWIKPF
jgi:hypothetical protein